jgi:hypothetical protein
MPKLKTARFIYATRTGRDSTAFEVEVHVGQNGDFYCRYDAIPEPIRKTNPDYATEKLTDATLRGLVAQIERLITGFEEAVAQRERVKVIRYAILLQGDLTPDLGGNDEKSRCRNDFDRDCTLGLGVSWEVSWKFKRLGQWQYDWISGNIGSYHRPKEMPWTPAREDWFESLDAEVRRLLLRIDTGIGDLHCDDLHYDDLMKLIDSGQALLTGPTKKG